jgi:hypothetical protein
MTCLSCVQSGSAPRAPAPQPFGQRSARLFGHGLRAATGHRQSSGIHPGPFIDPGPRLSAGRASCACPGGSGAIAPEALFDHWPQGELAQAQAAGTLDQYIRECERGYIQQALQRCQGQIAHTAAYLGISRKNLWEKMKRLQIPSRAQEGE